MAVLAFNGTETLMIVVEFFVDCCNHDAAPAASISSCHGLTETSYRSLVLESPERRTQYNCFCDYVKHMCRDQE